MKIRPSLEEGLVVLTVRVPPSLIGGLDRVAKHQCKRRAEVIRKYIIDGLMVHGLIDDRHIA